MKIDGQDQLTKLVRFVEPSSNLVGDISEEKAIEVIKEVERILSEKDQFVLRGGREAGLELFRKPGEDPLKYLQRMIKAQLLYKGDIPVGGDSIKREGDDPLLKLLLSLQGNTVEEGAFSELKEESNFLREKDQALLRTNKQTGREFQRKPGEEPSKYLERVFKILTMQKDGRETGGESLKTVRQDPLLKLLLAFRSKPTEGTLVSKEQITALTKDVENILLDKNQKVFQKEGESKGVWERKPLEEPHKYLHRVVKALLLQKEAVKAGGEAMKVEGQDPLLKLLLSLQVKPGENTEITEEKALAVTKEVEKILGEKDQVILRSGVKAEVEFIRRPGEDPSKYLQRISTEMAKLREEEKILNHEKKALSEDLHQKMTLQALYHGLGQKDKSNRKEENEIQKNIESRGPLLLIFIVVLLGLGIFLFFR